MDTKYLSEPTENILKLLKSYNVQDVLLGVIWCKRELGTKWCKKNFTFKGSSSIHPQGVFEKDNDYFKRINNFPTNCTKEGEEFWAKFKDCGILLGPLSIEWFSKEAMYYTKQDVIYEE